VSIALGVCTQCLHEAVEHTATDRTIIQPVMSMEEEQKAGIAARA
jgi:hypothetical protein